MPTGVSSAGWHALADFIRCPRRYAYRWVLGADVRHVSKPLAIGTCFHRLAEACYLGRPHANVLDELEPRIAGYGKSALELFDAYLRYYAHERLDVVAVEHEVQVLVNGRQFTRRLDLVYRDRKDGSLVVMDHKTAGRPSERMETARADWSLLTQAMIAKATFPSFFGAPFSHFVLNLIPTGDELGFRRQPVTFSARELEQVPRALDYYLRAREALLEVDAWQWPTSGACIERYGVCQYRQLCEAGPAMLPAFVIEREEEV